VEVVLQDTYLGMLLVSAVVVVAEVHLAEQAEVAQQVKDMQEGQVPGLRTMDLEVAAVQEVLRR
jgi:hypothetical protein